MCLIYIFISWITSTKVIGLKFIRGHLGSQGSKGHFHQNCYFSYRLHGMVMWLIYIHQLDNLYKSYRFKIHPGSFGVTGVKRSISPKLLFLLQITWYGHVTHAYWSDRYLYRSNRSKNSSGVIWGHRGQKGHFTKIAISPTDYMVWSCDSCIFISQIPSTKTFGLKFTRGHLGSQGSKGHFHQKCYFSFRVHGMVMRLLHIDQLDTLYKSYRIKIHLGSLGVTGVKSSFSQKNAISPIYYMVWTCDSCIFIR